MNVLMTIIRVSKAETWFLSCLFGLFIYFNAFANEENEHARDESQHIVHAEGEYDEERVLGSSASS